VRAVPLDDLEGASGDRKERIGELEEKRAQTRVAPGVGFRRVVGERHRDAPPSVELAEVVDRLAANELLQRAQIGNGRRFGAAADEQPVTAEREGERVRGQRLRPDMSGREASRRMHAVNDKRIGEAGPHEIRDPRKPCDR
jgi:hypothetical protein